MGIDLFRRLATYTKQSKRNITRIVQGFDLAIIVNHSMVLKKGTTQSMLDKIG